MKCWLCNEEHDPESAKPEHILLNCLGGRKTTRYVICSCCNETWGKLADNEVGNRVADIRCHANLVSGDGDPPPTIPYTLKDGTRIKLHPGGIPEILTVQYERTNTTENKMDVLIGVSSLPRLASLMSNFAKGIGKTTDEFLSVISAGGLNLQKRYIDELLQFQLSWGGPLMCRSFAKACGVLAGSEFGIEHLHSVEYQRFHQYVTDDPGSENQQLARDTMSLDGRELPECSVFDSFGPMFNMISIVSDSVGRTVGYFRLYNSMAWIYRLSESSSLKNRSVTLLSDPENPRNWNVLRDEALLPYDWFTKPRFTPEMMKGPMSKMMAHIHDKQNREHASITTDEIIRSVLENGGGERVITKNDIEMISRKMALEYTRIRNHMSSVERLDGEDVVAELKRLIEVQKK